MNISQRIAKELEVRTVQVEATIQLLDDGSTVPFIARYRKEVTQGLDDTQLRNLEERLGYLRELEDRRSVILASIGEQGKLTGELTASINQAQTKTRLEDLYAPYRKKRRTKAQIAREAGIESFLQSILDDPSQTPDDVARTFVNEEAGFPDPAAVKDGARQIFMERAAEEADLVGELRNRVWNEGRIESTVVEDKKEKGSKFTDYFDYSEQANKIPSHRVLALFRGRGEGVLRLQLVVPGQDDLPDYSETGVCESRIAQYFNIAHRGRAADDWLAECVRWTWRVKLSTSLETGLNTRLREQAEAEAIAVFGNNLRDLLLAAPAGSRTTMGLDPGLRTGVKVVVVDETGKLLEHDTIFPHQPRNQWDSSIQSIALACARHKVDLISIGNGTASRETDKLVKALTKLHPQLGLKGVMVSEAGASVYSASERAAKEFPDLDVSFRGAVSIARRLQDPLAELVKIEPKSIGVGQYQHDLNQAHLSRKLDAIVEDCVNAVGVSANTASSALLSRVAGLNETLSGNIVAFREQHGRFKNRRQLLKVPRLGPKAFEQAAGFLRITDGDNPLDASAVHPEAYQVVQNILDRSSRETKQIDKIIGDKAFLGSLRPADYADEKFGEPTVSDIIRELEKPGRDPRPEFQTAVFREGIESIADLQPGMILEGTVSNVANFGAFVDIGVHQDGLVHISALADKFVKDPREVVKAGDVVKVKVVSIDEKRRRIALTMRLQETLEPKESVRQPEAGKGRHKAARPGVSKQPAPQKNQSGKHTTGNTMANAFSKLKR